MNCATISNSTNASILPIIPRFEVNEQMNSTLTSQAILGKKPRAAPSNDQQPPLMTLAVSSIGSKTKRDFERRDYEEIGASLCKVLSYQMAKYFAQKEGKGAVSTLLRDILQLANYNWSMVFTEEKETEYMSSHYFSERNLGPEEKEGAVLRCLPDLLEIIKSRVERHEVQGVMARDVIKNFLKKPEEIYSLPSRSELIDVSRRSPNKRHSTGGCEKNIGDKGASDVGQIIVKFDHFINKLIQEREEFRDSGRALKVRSNFPSIDKIEEPHVRTVPMETGQMRGSDSNCSLLTESKQEIQRTTMTRFKSESQKENREVTPKLASKGVRVSNKPPRPDQPVMMSNQRKEERRQDFYSSPHQRSSENILESNGQDLSSQQEGQPVKSNRGPVQKFEINSARMKENIRVFQISKKENRTTCEEEEEGMTVERFSLKNKNKISKFIGKIKDSKSGFTVSKEASRETSVENIFNRTKLSKSKESCKADYTENEIQIIEVQKGNLLTRKPFLKKVVNQSQTNHIPEIAMKDLEVTAKKKKTDQKRLSAALVNQWTGLKELELRKVNLNEVAVKKGLNKLAGKIHEERFRRESSLEDKENVVKLNGYKIVFSKKPKMQQSLQPAKQETRYDHNLLQHSRDRSKSGLSLKEKIEKMSNDHSGMHLLPRPNRGHGSVLHTRVESLDFKNDPGDEKNLNMEKLCIMTNYLLEKKPGEPDSRGGSVERKTNQGFIIRINDAQPLPKAKATTARPSTLLQHAMVESLKVSAGSRERQHSRGNTWGAIEPPKVKSKMSLLAGPI